MTGDRDATPAQWVRRSLDVAGQPNGPRVGVELHDTVGVQRRKLTVMEPRLHAALDVGRNPVRRRVGDLGGDVARDRRDGASAFISPEVLEQVPTVWIGADVVEIVIYRLVTG